MKGSKREMLRTDLTIDYMLKLVIEVIEEKFKDVANSMAFKVRNDHP